MFLNNVLAFIIKLFKMIAPFNFAYISAHFYNKRSDIAIYEFAPFCNAKL